MTFTPVTVTHDFDLPDGSALLGTVEFSPAEPMHNGAKTVSGTRRAVLAAGGVLSQVLDATTDPATTPPGVPYKVVIRLSGLAPQTFYARVPHDQGSTIDLAALLAWASGSLAGVIGSSVDATPQTLNAVSGVITPQAATHGVFVHLASADVSLADPVGAPLGSEVVVGVLAVGGDRVLSFGGADPVTIPSGSWYVGRLRQFVGSGAWVLTDGSGSGSSGTIADGSLALSKLATTGTASSSTFLRGDGAWTAGTGGAPSGGAGGVLSGSYPNPGFAVDMATQAELDTAIAGRAAATHTHPASDIASGTVASARLGSGTASSSTFLRGDATWSPATAVTVDGVAAPTLAIDSTAIGWADLPRRASWSSARYYAPRAATLGSNSEPTDQELRLVPEFVPNAVTISEISTEITLAGSTGSTVRLVIADDSGGRPGSVVYCSGAIAATTTGKKSATGLSVALPAGRYYFGALPQGNPTTKPQFRSVLAPVEMTEQPDTPTYQRAAYSRYGVAAALSGAVGTVGLDAGDAPRVQVLVA